VGFRIEIATNSPDVIRAAEESWSQYSPEFAGEPITFRVVVQPEGDVSGEPVHRLHGALYGAVSDPYNFAVVDVRALSAVIYVSEKTAANRHLLRWYYIESLAYLLLSQRHLVAVHAACISRDGIGLLLAGASGAGKSSLSFACARAGWTFLSDDCTWLLPRNDDSVALGRPLSARFRLDAPALFPELADHVSRMRPNGKISIEVPMAAFPEIRTADRASIRGVVLLDRRSGPVRLDTVAAIEAAAFLLQDMPSYGNEVNAVHESAVLRLTAAGAFRLHYESLDDAVQALNQLMTAP
jgi:hypothetical protein